MLTTSMQDAINDQIQKELYSAYLYLAMAAYCEANNLPGAGIWMQAQAKEETGHAMKFFAYVNDRGARVTLKALGQPPAEFASLLDVFQKALAHEREVTKSIGQLYALSTKENDYATQAMLQWLITEQVEEEKNASQIVEQLKIAGESKGTLLMIDHHLAKRGAA